MHSSRAIGYIGYKYGTVQVSEQPTQTTQYKYFVWSTVVDFPSGWCFLPLETTGWILTSSAHTTKINYGVLVYILNTVLNCPHPPCGSR